ncbi:MAG: hypothetical protein U1E83_05360 [Methylotetracoccus sp.]
MNSNKHAMGSGAALAAVVVTALALSGCGGDGGSSGGSGKTEASAPVTPSDHQVFEQKYTEQCIAAQQSAANGQPTNDQEITKLCECIAGTISKRLSKADAIHFNKKNEFPFDLVMMTQSAEITCTSGGR